MQTTHPSPSNSGRLSLGVLLFLISLGVAQALYFRPELPLKVASHFDGAGRPNGWMSRDGFVLFQCGLLVGLGAVFGLVGRWLPLMPNSTINLPHKEYWLAPERRAASLAFMAAWMRWFGAGTVAFLLMVFHFVVRANLGTGRLDNTWFFLSMGIFLTGLTIAFVLMYRRFRAPAAHRG